MPLYDITHPKDRLITPEHIEEIDLFKAMRSRMPKNTWERVVKTVEEAVDSVQPNQTSRLVWTRASALFGHSSEQPKKWIDHLWDKIIAVVGDGKMCLLSVGCLLRWTIAKRPETWLCYKRETDEYDEETEKQITISEYWINNDYVPKGKIRE